jgi:preprotein translocase subunit YajC
MNTSSRSVKPGDMVVTSKGNYGRVVSVGGATAMVKIGAKKHEIEVNNIINVNDGTHFKVTYSDGSKEVIELVFIRYNTVIWDMFSPNCSAMLINAVENVILKKLTVDSIKILKIQIP